MGGGQSEETPWRSGISPAGQIGSFSSGVQMLLPGLLRPVLAPSHSSGATLSQTFQNGQTYVSLPLNSDFSTPISSVTELLLPVNTLPDGCACSATPFTLATPSPSSLPPLTGRPLHTYHLSYQPGLCFTTFQKFPGSGITLASGTSPPLDPNIIMTSGQLSSSV